MKVSHQFTSETNAENAQITFTFDYSGDTSFELPVKASPYGLTRDQYPADFRQKKVELKAMSSTVKVWMRQVTGLKNGNGGNALVGDWTGNGFKTNITWSPFHSHHPKGQNGIERIVTETRHYAPIPETVFPTMCSCRVGELSVATIFVESKALQSAISKTRSAGKAKFVPWTHSQNKASVVSFQNIMQPRIPFPANAIYLEGENPPAYTQPSVSMEIWTPPSMMLYAVVVSDASGNWNVFAGSGAQQSFTSRSSFANYIAVDVIRDGYDSGFLYNASNKPVDPKVVERFEKHPDEQIADSSADGLYINLGRFQHDEVSSMAGVQYPTLPTGCYWAFEASGVLFVHRNGKIVSASSVMLDALTEMETRADKKSLSYDDIQNIERVRAFIEAQEKVYAAGKFEFSVIKRKVARVEELMKKNNGDSDGLPF